MICTALILSHTPAPVLQIIIRERPYAVMMYPAFTESHCHLCFRELGEEPIPCKGCDQVTFYFTFSRDI